MANQIFRKIFRVWLPSLLALCVVGSRLQAQTRWVETPVAVLQLSERTGDLIGLHLERPGVRTHPRTGLSDMRFTTCESYSTTLA
jgi:hypothetical protein